MIKKFEQFILEKKVFIYTRSFRLINLLPTNLYSAETIESWKALYGYDDYATCIFISEEKIKKPSELSIKLKGSDIKNKSSFNTDTAGYKGTVMPDSRIEIEGDIVYLYVFDKNSNQNKRARQNHGFRYEGTVKRLNGLKQLKYTDKWDAEGTLDKRYIDEKILVDCKKVEVGTKSSRAEADWDSIADDFKEYLNWNIKSMANGTDVELGDFLRISGYEKQGDSLAKRNIRNEKSFMFCVSFHDNSTERKVLEEYLVLMPIESWRTYLPDMEGNLEQFESMYKDLKEHRLVGERTDDSEAKWAAYRKKYEKLFKDSIIKIRFKRDSKGQLRLQCAMSYSNFMNSVLNNRHIKIS